MARPAPAGLTMFATTSVTPAKVEVLDLLGGLNCDEGRTVVLVLHDLNQQVPRIAMPA